MPIITSPAVCPCHQIPKSRESKARATAETEGAARKRPKRFDGVGDAACWTAEPETQEEEACRACPGTGTERETELAEEAAQ